MKTPKYRIFWTWDMASNWDKSDFSKIRGCSGKNFRRATFLEDYKRMVDYAAAHNFNGIVIWGAVRAHNDGVNQLKELVKYGRERGVRILPGVSAFSYGGIFYDPTDRAIGGHDRTFGSHPYSLHTWLQKHPEYAALNEDGKPYSEMGPLNILACPSRPETLEWFKEGLKWLYEEFDIDGIQIEVGDYSICHCPLCTERRKKETGLSKSYSITDMSETYAAAVEVSLAAKPDAWVICETYSGFAYCNTPDAEVGWGWKSMPIADRELLAALPEKSILQWSADRAIGGYATQHWDEKIYSPKPDNILRIHAGCQWSQNGPADWAPELIWQLVTEARKQGVNGVSVFGEESYLAPPNEANYLAFEEACGLGRNNPNLSLEDFYKYTLDPLYGGEGMAAKWRSLYIKACMLTLKDRFNEFVGVSRQKFEDLTDEPGFKQKATTYTKEEREAALESYYKQARELSYSIQDASADVYGRWSWLENELRTMHYTVSTRPEKTTPTQKEESTFLW